MSELNLDQALTSAMTAMAFATKNWPQFCTYLESIIGRPVPINQHDMNLQAMLLAKLTDPDRMPA